MMQVEMLTSPSPLIFLNFIATVHREVDHRTNHLRDLFVMIVFPRKYAAQNCQWYKLDWSASLMASEACYLLSFHEYKLILKSLLLLNVKKN